MILTEAGFTLERLEEYHPSATDLVERPDLAGELDRPMFPDASAQDARR
jgi:hypothetical protein